MKQSTHFDPSKFAKKKKRILPTMQNLVIDEDAGYGERDGKAMRSKEKKKKKKGKREKERKSTTTTTTTKQSKSKYRNQEQNQRAKRHDTRVGKLYSLCCVFPEPGASIFCFRSIFRR